jgi:glycine/D-amino acid oxidase-like deaminating enzyme
VAGTGVHLGGLRPYLYIRTTKDGRVIRGGEDEEFSDEAKRDALIPEKTAILSAKLAKLFPRLDATADNAWTGCFGGTVDDLPSISPLPGMANCYGVLAFGGNGITFSRIAAEIIRARLTGKDAPEADLFAFR